MHVYLTGTGVGSSRFPSPSSPLEITTALPLPVIRYTCIPSFASCLLVFTCITTSIVYRTAFFFAHLLPTPLPSSTLPKAFHLLHPTPPPAHKAECRCHTERRKREPYERRIRLSFPTSVRSVQASSYLPLSILAAVGHDVVFDVGCAGAGVCAEFRCHSLLNIPSVSSVLSTLRK